MYLHIMFTYKNININLCCKNITINYVNAPIMNQLSYHVDDSKIKKHGFKIKGSLENDIKNTLKLLHNLKR